MTLTSELKLKFCAYIPEIVSNIYLHYYIQFVLKTKEINLAAFQHQQEKRAKSTNRAGYMLRKQKQHHIPLKDS